MKSKIKSFFFFFSFFLITFLIFAILTVPKFLLLERFLLQKGIYILAEGVEEGVFNIKLKKAQAYNKQSSIGSFDVLELYLRPFHALAKGKCEDGQFEARLFPSRRVEIKGKSLRCFERLYVRSVHVEMKDYILGKAEFSDIKLPNLVVDELRFNFKGRTFDAEAKAFGISLVGGGVVSFGKEVSINGQLTGMGMRFLISGKLSSPSFELQR